MNKEQKGLAVKRILNDPLLKEALQSMRDDCYQSIESSAFFQRRNREEAYKLLRTINSFENKLKKAVENGAVEGAKQERRTQKVAKFNKL